jgi:hypothetical protein
MPDEITPPNNFDRLLEHLKDKSLAAPPVQAYARHHPAEPRVSRTSNGP